MAPSSKRRGLTQPIPLKELSRVLVSREWVRSSVVGIALLFLLFLGLDSVNQGGISCFFPKHYSLKLMGHIRGEDEPCGAFKVAGITYIKGMGIVVSDQEHNRFLLFDLKGQFLQVLSVPPPFQSTMVTDPQSGRTYSTDFEKSRILVTDRTGKIQRSIYVRDKPVAVALDGDRTLFVGFGNHYFLQAYTLEGRLKGDARVVNPDPDYSYLDVISLSGTEQGVLVAADPYSVWIYQLPQ